MIPRLFINSAIADRSGQVSYLTSPSLSRVIAASILVLLTTVSAAENGVSTSGISASLPGLFEQFSRQSGIVVPDLQAEDIETLIAGKSIIVATSDAGLQPNGGVEAMGLLGLQLVEAPRLLVWLTVLGGGGRSDDRLTSVKLSRMPAGAYSRYQHVNLPWPIRDRHWVITCEKNLELAHASAGAIWEHRWFLHESGKQLLRTAFEDKRIPGLEPRTLDTAVYLPANRGTWALFDLGQNQTLIVAFYDADLGGRLPGGLVRSFTKRQLRKYLEATEALTGHVLQYYDENAPIHDGFGLPITHDVALDAARAWKNR